MKPDWDSLAADFKDSKTVIVADVDCTTAGKPLCEKFGVKGYPTIKFFNPPDEEGEDYKGGRDLPALKKFCETELGPGCSVDLMDNCSDEQKEELKTYIAMEGAERATKMETLKTAMKAAEDKHQELLKRLQSEFKESQDGLEKLKDESSPVIKLLKAATRRPRPAARARTRCKLAPGTRAVRAHRPRRRRAPRPAGFVGVTQRGAAGARGLARPRPTRCPPRRRPTALLSVVVLARRCRASPSGPPHARSMKPSRLNPDRIGGVLLG